MKTATRPTRLFALILAVCMVMVHVGDAEAKKRSRSNKRQTVSRALGVNDPRYAAVIMNPATGEIYHQQDADARRYPASLTKMMTLYLLFEALEQRKISLDDRMDVSELASRQPQTNLSLDEGDRIDVETAIKALVVRSANDVSVVVAEALGGSVENFAAKMTAKARALGMQGTVFKNPNGLPNTAQYTTARDMAKLGIALKRDFPKYYHYFSTLQFSHNGVTYYTHNRVMLRYAGVDGIKTGYIGLSGFNLVTSVVRGGRPVVGVVMGGGSGGWRDNRMIQLLDATYQTIASRGAARGKMYPSNLPTPKAGSKAAGISEAIDPNTPQIAMDEKTLPEATEPEDGGTAGEELPPAALPSAAIENNAVEAASPFNNALEEPQQAPAKFQPKVTQTPSRSRVISVKEATTTPAPAVPANSPFAMASEQPAPPPETMTIPPKPAAEPISLANPPRTKPDDYIWGIQVGAFSTQALAEQAVQTAQQTAARQLIGAKSAVVGPADSGAKVYRARIENISQPQAKRACEALIAAHSPCFIYKAP